MADDTGLLIFTVQCEGSVPGGASGLLLCSRGGYQGEHSKMLRSWGIAISAAGLLTGRSVGAKRRRRSAKPKKLCDLALPQFTL